ncbi:MAG: cell division topological specificity factor MinE [Clostridia bacterium]|jgi:cell division topological specificity factor|nr:cell division topological specificity factor MinE [Clostridia bacterium]
MFENIANFFKNIGKKGEKKQTQENSRDTAKERLHLVLMQDRANVSADFLELMKQEIIDVIKKYIEIDEKEIDVRLTNKENEDGTNGAPALYANIPILNIRNDTKKINKNDNIVENDQEENNKKQENEDIENKKENENNNIEEEEKTKEEINSDNQKENKDIEDLENNNEKKD